MIKSTVLPQAEAKGPTWPPLETALSIFKVSSFV